MSLPPHQLFSGSADASRSSVAELDSNPDGLLLTDLRGRISAVNQTACILTGCTRAELFQLTSINDIAPEVWPAASSVSPKGSGLEEDGSLLLRETELIGKEGQRIPVEIHCYAIQGRSPEDAAYGYVIRDKRGGRERAGDQIHLLHKMRSVRHLAAVVAHDVNNLIGVVLGHAEIGMLDLDESHPVYAALKEIEDAALRATELTGKLLRVAGRAPCQPEIIEWNEWITALLPQLHDATGPHIEIVWKPCPVHCPVQIDPEQVQRLLMIPIDNAREAIEAMPTGSGTILLSLTHVTATPDEEFCEEREVRGRFACLSITDDGAGMDRAVQAQAFDPFFTTRAPSKGRGLGLSTLYGLVQQNHGFVEMDSQAQTGTVLKIYLPLV